MGNRASNEKEQEKEKKLKELTRDRGFSYGGLADAFKNKGKVKVPGKDGIASDTQSEEASETNSN